MEYKIHGTVFQCIEFRLNKGESVLSEPGRFLWKSTDVEMRTYIEGGVIEGIKRKITGEELMLVRYTAKKDGQRVALSGEIPGMIAEVELKGDGLVFERSAFLAGIGDVSVNPHIVKSISYGLLSKNKFIFQRIEGYGKAFISVAGELTILDIGDETLQVDLSSLVGFSPDVKLKATLLRGVDNILFSGTDLFLAEVRGPGRLYIQNTPYKEFLNKFQKSIPKV